MVLMLNVFKNMVTLILWFTIHVGHFIVSIYGHTHNKLLISQIPDNNKCKTGRLVRLHNHVRYS